MEGNPPGDALPPPPQRATPARKGARCGDGAGSTRPHRPHPGHTGRGTLAARSGGRAAGGGTAPDTRRPSQRWKAPPPGTPFRHPHSEQRRPARAHAVGAVPGPHARIDRTRDTRVAEPGLRAPEDERPGEGQRLTPGAPHNGGRHPPRGRPSATPTASNAGPQGRTLRGRCRVHTPASTAPGTHGSQNPGCTLRRTSGRGRDSAWHQAPLTTVVGTPPGDALPPPPQRATPARKGTRCGAGAGSTRPHRPHPGHAGRRTLAARSGGRAAEGGTAPDTRRPSQRWKAAPPGDALPPPPQRTTPARKCARRGAGTGSTRPHQPHPGHTGRGTLAARSGGRAAGEGTAPDTRRPSQRWSAPPPGTPFRHPHSEQCRPARAHAVGPVLGPHARIDRTRDTRVAEPWPCTLRRTTAAGGGTAPDTRRPTQQWKALPPGTPFRQPQQRATPARKGARCGAGAGPARPHRPHPGHTGRGTLAARSGGRATGRGTAPNTGRPSQHWKAPPRGCPSTTPTPSNAPTHQRTSHGTSTPRPLLLDTAT